MEANLKIMTVKLGTFWVEWSIWMAWKWMLLRIVVELSTNPPGYLCPSSPPPAFWICWNWWIWQQIRIKSPLPQQFLPCENRLSVKLRDAVILSMKHVHCWQQNMSQIPLFIVNNVAYQYIFLLGDFVWMKDAIFLLSFLKQTYFSLIWLSNHYFVPSRTDSWLLYPNWFAIWYCLNPFFSF